MPVWTLAWDYPITRSSVRCDSMDLAWDYHQVQGEVCHAHVDLAWDFHRVWDRGSKPRYHD